MEPPTCTSPDPASVPGPSSDHSTVATLEPYQPESHLKRGHDVLLFHDLPDHLSYRAIHDLVKPYGNVARIRRVYDDDTPANRCYVAFATAKEAATALRAVGTFGFPGVCAEVLSSANLLGTDSDYIPNVFESTAAATPPAHGPAPTPRWFVAYYRNGRGNFIHAFKFLLKEFGSIPRESIRKYGKGLLIKAKDLTQARMLLHFRCDPTCLFDSIRPHRTFNFSRGIVYNYDLFEFSEEEIYDMCPPTVQKIWKVKGKGNMIVLTFYGSCLPDYIHVGPLRLSIKPFIERPLQCFNCYEFGHGRKHCTNSPRCGRCSALNAHSTDDCVKSPYCLHCRAEHQLRSRDCPHYRFEQDVLQLANTNHISLGSARRELAHMLGETGQVKSYASTLAPRAAARASGSQEQHIHHSPSPASLVASARNRFSPLHDLSADVPVSNSSPTKDEPLLLHDIPAPRSPRRRDSRKTASKRQHGSTDSVESSSVPPPKVSVCSPRVRSADRASSAAAVDFVRPLERSSSQGTVVPATPVAAFTSPNVKSVDAEIHNPASPPHTSTSPASVPSIARGHIPAISASPGTSASGAVARKTCSDANSMIIPRSDSAPSRSSPSHLPALPRAGPSGTKDSRRLSLPGKVGKAKGKSSSGTHLIRTSK